MKICYKIKNIKDNNAIRNNHNLIMIYYLYLYIFPFAKKDNFKKILIENKYISIVISIIN